MSKYEFDIILKEIKQNLTEKAMMIPELADQISSNDDKFMKVFRWLLDHGKIVRDEYQRYRWSHVD
jgi:hypothetical protein